LHAGGSFALVTPFAQQYDAPWLYGVAALAGLGRIEQRQHYVSDVVAGSLIGYAVGSITLYSNQHGGPRLALTGGRGVQASWQF
jgi:membrane-associated phospholipid phosphatase